MKILQIVPELKCGGVETGTLDISRALVEAGHEAYVISAGGPMVESLESSGAIHVELPVNEKSIVNALMHVRRVAEVIEKYKIDVVHARSRVPAWIGYFAARRTKRPFVTTCHGYYKKHFFSSAMGWGKLVIAISQPIARHMHEDFGVPLERIRLIPRGVDLKRFEFIPRHAGAGHGVPLHREFTIGIIGRITPIKGHVYFLKSLPQAARAVPRLRVLVVGDASCDKDKYKESLLMLVRRLGLSKSVEFLGQRDDVPQILKSLDALVLATTAPEAFGRVIIEANAAGVPVVATRVGGVVDVVKDGETGLLVEPQQPAAMAQAIIKLYREPALGDALAAAARKRAEDEFSLDKMASRTLEVYQEALKSQRVLVIKLGAPGDVVLATPSFKAVRNKFPAARISVLVGTRSGSIPMRSSCVDEVIIFDKGEDGGYRRIFGLAKELRKRNFEITIDLQNNLKTHLLAFLSGARDRYGWDNGKLSFLLNHKVSMPQGPMPPVEHQRRLLTLLGIASFDEKLELAVAMEDTQYIESILRDEWLGEKQLLVGFNLGSSKSWLTKRWPLEKFVSLQDKLSRNLSARVVLFGTKDEAALAGEYKSQTAVKPIDAVGRTSIMELAALIKRCDVIVSSDSAPIHIAAAVGTPFIAFFGPTDPARHLPPAEHCVVIKRGLSCAPCYRRECRSCACMREIGVDEVYEAVAKLLKNVNSV